VQRFRSYPVIHPCPYTPEWLGVRGCRISTSQRAPRRKVGFARPPSAEPSSDGIRREPTTYAGSKHMQRHRVFGGGAEPPSTLAMCRGAAVRPTPAVARPNIALSGVVLDARLHVRGVGLHSQALLSPTHRLGLYLARAVVNSLCANPTCCSVGVEYWCPVLFKQRPRAGDRRSSPSNLTPTMPRAAPAATMVAHTGDSLARLPRQGRSSDLARDELRSTRRV